MHCRSENLTSDEREWSENEMTIVHGAWFLWGHHFAKASPRLRNIRKLILSNLTERQRRLHGGRS